MSELQRHRLQFWEAFKDSASSRSVTYSLRKPSERHYYHVSLGHSGFVVDLNILRRLDLVRCGLYITHPAADEIYRRLRKKASAIERALRAELGATDVGALTWHAPPKRHARRIWIEQDGFPADPVSSRKASQWLITRAEAFLRTFKPRIVSLLQELEGSQSATLG